MQRKISELVEREHDVIVVGGGFFGACIAWDAALRGLSVALIDSDDFCRASSSNHFRMIHGGIRYLQHADIARVRESSRERRILLRVAPHLVYPLPVAVPAYGSGRTGRRLLSAAAAIYDALTYDRNIGITDPDRMISASRLIGSEQTLQLFPFLEPGNLSGSVVFYEAQTYNPSRLGLAFIQSAVGQGGTAANYVAATGFLLKNGRAQGVAARDLISGNDIEIRGRVVVNAAGAWAVPLLRERLGIELRPSPTFSRDACFVLKRQLASGYGLALQGKTRDPDAIMSRGRRHLFFVPWRDVTLAGVWHGIWQGPPEKACLTPEDVRRCLEELNSCGVALSVDDLAASLQGLVLFGRNESTAENLSYGKRSLIIDHERAHNLKNLITVIGVRFTTARGVAEKAVDLVFRKLALRTPQPLTAVTPVHGGKFERFSSMFSEAAIPGVSRTAIENLLHDHGTNYRAVLNEARQSERLLQELPDSSVLAAQVVHAARHEMAEKLVDVIYRRTSLGAAGCPGEPAMRACCELMAREKGWDRPRMEREISEVRQFFPNLAVQ